VGGEVDGNGVAERRAWEVRTGTFGNFACQNPDEEAGGKESEKGVKQEL
jgi:hypothetical protein